MVSTGVVFTGMVYTHVVSTILVQNILFDQPYSGCHYCYFQPLWCDAGEFLWRICASMQISQDSIPPMPDVWLYWTPKASISASLYYFFIHLTLIQGTLLRLPLLWLKLFPTPLMWCRGTPLEDMCQHANVTSFPMPLRTKQDSRRQRLSRASY